MTTRVALVLMVLGLVLNASARNAFGDPSREELSRAHTTVGASLYRSGQYEEALREFQAAFEASPKPILLINIAQCQRKVNDLRAALDTCERYLSAVGRNDPQRADVAALAQLIREQIANQPPTEALPETAVVEQPPTPPASTPQPAEVAPQTIQLVAPPPPSPRSRKRLWIGLGVGLGVLVAGAVTATVLLVLPRRAPSTDLGNHSIFP